MGGRVVDEAELVASLLGVGANEDEDAEVDAGGV
jgi:hypothetical protein